jgi:CheY-like chemotaxis protein
MDAMTAAVLGWGLLLVALVIIILFAIQRRATFSGKATPPGGMGGSFEWQLSAEVRTAINQDLQEANLEKGGPKEEVQSAKRQVAEVTSVRRGRILWVDDQPDVNVAEAIMLTSAGQSIVTATSTDTAMKHIQRWPWDVVITDLTRGEDERAGLQLIDWLKGARRLKTPVFVYTANPGDRREEAIRLGAAGVFTTPGPLLEAVLDALKVPSTS